MKVVESSIQSREINALGLDHVNIVKTINIFNNEKDKYTMVLMEYLPHSVQLQHVLGNINNDLSDKILKFSMDICEGLRYCHKKKILHLDVKPQNILVCENQCKLCDFGNSVNEQNLEQEFKHKVS